MAERLPAKIIKEFGQSWPIIFNGTFASFEANKRENVFAELPESGTEVIETSWLVELLET